MRRKEAVELFSLKCVILLANDPSPRSAAATLGIGVLSLLRRIRAVEAVLGCRFFRWEMERVYVTPDAREFIRIVQPAIGVIDEAIKTFSTAQRHPDVADAPN